jgi:NAD(P)H-dependent FMN reductase
MEISSLPLFNEDLMRDGAFPEPVNAARQILNTADGVLISTPEYNRSVPASLKNAIDWLSRKPQAFEGRVVAIIGVSAGGLGTCFANHHVRQILVYLNAVALPGPEFLLPHAATHFDSNMRLTDGGVRAFLADHMDRFADLVHRMRP